MIAILFGLVFLGSGQALQLSRRDVLSVGISSAGLSSCGSGARAAQCAPIKVCVVGGDGFIGSRVCRELVELGAVVTSVARRGAPPESAGSWASSVTWKKADVLETDVAPLLAGAKAVISCVGALGSADDEKANGLANERIVAAAKKAGASRFAYVSVYPLVGEAGASLLPDYFRGKAEAEAAIRSAKFDQATIIRPTLVYGGDVFNISPPRVPTYWGTFVEAVLSSPPLRLLADLAAPVPALKVALLPPVDVDTTARALARIALGVAPSVSDVVGTDAIKSIAATTC